MDFKNLEEIARYAVENFEGDLVEIGGGDGVNTKMFLKLAKEFNRKVIVIDPYEGVMPKGYAYGMDRFNSEVEPYKDYLILHKRSSLCETSHEILNRELSFAYIDGLQYMGAVMNDLIMTTQAGFQVVDDINRKTGDSQVPKAVEQYKNLMSELGFKLTLTIIDRWGLIK